MESWYRHHRRPRILIIFRQAFKKRYPCGGFLIGTGPGLDADKVLVDDYFGALQAVEYFN